MFIMNVNIFLKVLELSSHYPDLKVLTFVLMTRGDQIFQSFQETRQQNESLQYDPRPP